MAPTRASAKPKSDVAWVGCTEEITPRRPARAMSSTVYGSVSNAKGDAKVGVEGMAYHDLSMLETEAQVAWMSGEDGLVGVQNYLIRAITDRVRTDLEPLGYPPHLMLA